MVNPVSPLVLGEDIDAAINMFEDTNADSLISIHEARLHAFYKGTPLNFSTERLLPMTQDLDPIQICSWTVCVWRQETFMAAYEKNGYAAFSGNVVFYPMDPKRSIKISTEEDFRLASMEVSARNVPPEKIRYYE